MSKINDLMAVGVPSEAAKVIATESVNNNVTAQGTDLSGATQLASSVNVVRTAAASSGVKLPNFDVGMSVEVENLDSDTITVYPPTSTQTINAGSAGAGQTVAQNKCARFRRVSATDWRYTLLN